MRFRAPSRPLAARLVSRFFLSIVALAALFAAAYFGTLGVTHAQEGGDDLQRAFFVARADLAIRLTIAEDEISIKRAEPVIWNDACLGAAAPDELCAQVLTDGWVLWLLAGPGDFYRYHANLDGSVVRFGEALSPDIYYPDLPLPPGATLRPEAAPETPAPPLPATAADLLAAITAQTGFSTQVLQTFAPVTQPFITVSGTAFQVGATTGEVYELASPDEVKTITVALQFDGTIAPPANATLWAVGALIVILNDAPSHIAEQDAISAVIGDPLLLTIAGPLLPGTGGEASPPPGALPNTGSGGLAAGSTGFAPVWVWGIVAGVLVVLAGANYGFQRRFTPR